MTRPRMGRFVAVGHFVSVEKSLRQSFAVPECMTGDIAKLHVQGPHRVIADRGQLGNVYLAVLCQNRVIYADVNDFTDEDFAVFIVGKHSAFQRHGQLLDDGGVNLVTLYGCEAGMGKFVGDILAGKYTYIVGGCQLAFGSRADGEGFAGEDVGGSFVRLVKGQGNLRVVTDIAPGGVHGIGGAILVVGTDDKNRHGIKP